MEYYNKFKNRPISFNQIHSIDSTHKLNNFPDQFTLMLQQSTDCSYNKGMMTIEPIKLNKTK